MIRLIRVFTEPFSVFLFNNRADGTFSKLRTLHIFIEKMWKEESRAKSSWSIYVQFNLRPSYTEMPPFSNRNEDVLQ